MLSKYIYLLLLLIFAFASAFSSSIEEQADAIPGLGIPEVHKLTENVYAVTGLYHTAGEKAGVSAGIILTAKSIIFIDTGMTIASGEFLWQLAEKRIKGKKDLYLILTHHHSDHVFGMKVFKEKGAKIIAHNNVRRFLENDNGRYKSFILKMTGWSAEEGDKILGDVVLSAADQLLVQDTILNIDGDEIHLLVTPGHVPSELSIYHPKSKTLFAGDAVYQGIPPHTRFGGPAEWKLWISQLERLKPLEINAIVPGHGELCNKEEIDRNIVHLEEKISQTK